MAQVLPSPTIDLKRKRSASPVDLQTTMSRVSSSAQDQDAMRRKREAQVMELEKEVAAFKEKKTQENSKKEMEKMALTRGGGAYIPPFRLAQMNLQTPEDKSSEAFQRLTWEALRKSINGLINKVNLANIKMIVPELFNENLDRGRGLFCRSVMRAQASSQPFTPIFAALVAIINTKLPEIGELLVWRLISQFRRAYKRNDKTTSIATTLFIAHLVNQQVVGELLALEIIMLLLGKVTDDSIEIAVGFLKEVGAFLGETSPKPLNDIFDEFRRILNEDSTLARRSQYQIEVLFQVRKDKFKDNVTVPEGLDLVEDDDVVCHNIGLDDDDVQVMDMLNVFKFDPNFEAHEEEYNAKKREILGDSDSDESSEADNDEESDEEPETGIDENGQVAIHDHTGTDLTNLRRTIYLTIMSALDFEEAVHKLLKLQLASGEEPELCNMIIECCSQERSYSKFYGLMGERFCKLNPVWRRGFEDAFKTYFTTIHRFETNRLRNIARFFGHLLGSDGISWAVFEVVRINEDDTTSSSRIFIKILLQEIVEMLGLKIFAERFRDPSMVGTFSGMFPTDNPKNTRFAINYFTALSYGILTEGMRDHLKNAPQLIMQRKMEDSSSSDESSSDTDSDSSSGDSSSRSPSRSPVTRRRRSSSSPHRNGKDRSTSPPRRRRDSRSPPRRGRYKSESPPPRPRSNYRSQSPAPKQNMDKRNRSRSPPSRSRGDDYTPEWDRGDKARSPSPRRRNDYTPEYNRRGKGRSPSPRRRDFVSPPPRKTRRYS